MTRYTVHFTNEAWETIQAQVRYIAIDNHVHRPVFEQTYLVFYTIDQESKRVSIVSFRHGAQAEK